MRARSRRRLLARLPQALAFAVLFAAFAGSTWWGWSNLGPARPEARLAGAVPVQLAEVTRQSVAQQFSTVGEVIAGGRESGARLRVRFTIPSGVADRLDAAAPVRLVPPGGGAVVEVEIEAIDPVSGGDTPQVAIEAVLPRGQDGLAPGDFAAVQVPVMDREEALFVPRTALRDGSGEASVYTVDTEMRARRVAVEPGTAMRDRIAVRADGLEAGDRVVAEGVEAVRDGALVTEEEVTPASRAVPAR